MAATEDWCEPGKTRWHGVCWWRAWCFAWGQIGQARYNGSRCRRHGLEKFDGRCDECDAEFGG